MLSCKGKKRHFSDALVPILMGWTLHCCMGRFKRTKNHYGVSYPNLCEGEDYNVPLPPFPLPLGTSVHHTKLAEIEHARLSTAAKEQVLRGNEEWAACF